MQIGARVLDLAEWLEVDELYARDLAEKRSLMATRPAQVFAALPVGLAASEEVLALVTAHLHTRFPACIAHCTSDDAIQHPLARAALMVQEDLCVMSLVDGEWILSAASVCFPNRWDLMAKMGRSLAGIHEPVPHYTARIGVATSSLFHKLTVDRPVWRLNWTIMDSPVLHQPVAAPQPDALQLRGGHLAENLWFRRERQTLRKLPQSGDILFTIRTYVDSLAAVVKRDPDFRRNLSHTIADIDQAMVDYKGWAAIKPQLTEWARGE
jgi:hypothetical protein